MFEQIFVLLTLASWLMISSVALGAMLAELRQYLERETIVKDEARNA
jgi:hypothetical protein